MTVDIGQISCLRDEALLMSPRFGPLIPGAWHQGAQSPDDVTSLLKAEVSLHEPVIPQRDKSIYACASLSVCTTVLLFF